MSSLNSYFIRPNTDISTVKMETRQCEGCGKHFEVAATSPHTHHSLFCANLPKPESWKNRADREEMADRFNVQLEKVKPLINQIPVKWQNERRAQKVEEK